MHTGMLSARYSAPEQWIHVHVHVHVQAQAQAQAKLGAHCIHAEPSLLLSLIHRPTILQTAGVFPAYIAMQALSPFYFSLLKYTSSRTRFSPS